MSGHERGDQLQNHLKHHITGRLGTHAFCREACSTALPLVESSSSCTTVLERLSAERCRQGNPAPRSHTGGRAGKASLEFLFFDRMGEVCRHVTRHCLYDRLLMRQIQSTVMLNYRQPDSELFGNKACCTTRTFTDKHR